MPKCCVVRALCQHAAVSADLLCMFLEGVGLTLPLPQRPNRLLAGDPANSTAVTTTTTTTAAAAAAVGTAVVATASCCRLAKEPVVP